MFNPSLQHKRITDITLDDLKLIGVNSLLLDVDNTLSTHHGMSLAKGLSEWIELMNSNGIKLLILSNSKERRVQPFARKIGLDYISLGLKPLPFGYIRGVRKLGEKKKNVALVGDQIFTDVLGAKGVFMKVILLEPILLETKFSFKWRRWLEKYIRPKLKEKYKR